MRLIFLGTPEFAVPSLEALVAAGHEVAAVYTQPDRPRGRGRQLAAPPVKEAAMRHGMPVRQPERIRRPEVIEEIRQLAPEVMVVVGYGQILPPALLAIPPRGILNVHASLLPKYRGAAPIQWAIANGEWETGVTIMKIDEGLDTGDILLQRATEIGEQETAPELAARLAVLGAELLVEALGRLDEIRPRPQNHELASYAPVLKKEDGRIDWRWEAKKIYNRSRGFVPWPGTYTEFRGQILHIWKAKPLEDAELGPPGTLHASNRRLMVACGNQTALELLEVQLEGRKRMSAKAFLNGQRLHGIYKLGE
jgi:methionyl-tRNA formyltransferase